MVFKILLKGALFFGSRLAAVRENNYFCSASIFEADGE